MKLKDEFITYESDGEQLMVSCDSSFTGLVRSNQTAAFIVDCLKTETTEQEIVDRMFERYDAPRDVLERDVARIIAQLRSIHALDE